MIGSGATTPGPINAILGPIFAPDFEIAKKNVDTLAARDQGKLRIDVPSGSKEFMGYLQSKGFNMVSNLPVMITP